MAVSRLEQLSKCYGLTSAISTSHPNEIDHIYTHKLVEAMKPYGVFEDEAELNQSWRYRSREEYKQAGGIDHVKNTSKDEFLPEECKEEEESQGGKRQS